MHLFIFGVGCRDILHLSCFMNMGETPPVCREHVHTGRSHARTFFLLLYLLMTVRLYEQLNNEQKNGISCVVLFSKYVKDGTKVSFLN